MNITLPDKLKQYVDVQVKEGAYADASDFLREALRVRMAASVRDAKAIDTGNGLPDVRGAVATGDIDALVAFVMREAAGSASR
jgi:putative addiction module CopG family antidote